MTERPAAGADVAGGAGVATDTHPTSGESALTFTSSPVSARSPFSARYPFLAGKVQRSPPDPHGATVVKSDAPTAGPLPRAELPPTPPDLSSLWKAVEVALAKVAEEAVRIAVAAIPPPSPAVAEVPSQPEG